MFSTASTEAQAPIVSAAIPAPQESTADRVIIFQEGGHFSFPLLYQRKVRVKFLILILKGSPIDRC